MLGRVGVAIAASDPRYVYTVIEAEKGVMWRSTNGGETWEMTNEDKTVHSRPFYFSDIRVDPQNENRVYLIEGQLRVSDDGGRSWDIIGNTVHGDHQALWIDPVNPRRLINGNDGGWGFSYDRGETWEFINSVAIGQFYQLTVDMQDPYEVCGGLQDNHVWCAPSNNLTHLGILNGDWYRIHPGGDGYYVQVDPTDPNTLYTNTHFGNIVRVDRKTGDARAIQPYPVNMRGSAEGEHPYRFNWNSPIHMSPHDPKTIYFGSNVLFKTTNEGQSWEEVSPDLSTNDPEKIQVSGGPITPDNTSAEYHCAISSIAESPITPGLIWVGTDDGKVQLTRNGGAAWEDLTVKIPGQTPDGWISRVEASKNDAATAYIAVNRHRSNDFSAHVFKTSDYGQTWTNIAGDLPPLNYVHVVREDPKNPNLIFVGTELGLYASWTGGDHWVSLRLNLPRVAVREILVHPRDNDLVIGTHGRSAWILDDITPLQHVGQALVSDAFLFEPRRATRWELWNRNHAGYPGQRWLGDQTFYGENPPYGAIINYYLKEVPSGEEKAIALTVLGANQEEVRTLEGPADAGVHRVVWDLRHDPLPEPKGVAKVGFNPSAAPLVPPGDYTVRLVHGGEPLTARFEVRLDPRIDFSESDALAQYRAVRRLTDMEARAIQALETIEAVSTQLQQLGKKIDGLEAVPETTRDDLTDRVTQIEESLDGLSGELVRRTPNLGYRSSAKLLEKIRQLRSGTGNFPGIEGPSAAPTDAQAEWLGRFDAQLKEVEQNLERLVSVQISELNQKLGEAGVAHVTMP